MRGSCATHLIMCHCANMTHLRKPGHIKIPPLREFIALNEALATACGALTKATTVGIALNTSLLDEQEARETIAALEQQCGLPVEDWCVLAPQNLEPRCFNPNRPAPADTLNACAMTPLCPVDARCTSIPKWSSMIAPEMPFGLACPRT